jgi:hypothetical protein
MRYRSTFLYIVRTDFYTLLLIAGDAASLIIEDLLKRSPATSGVPRRLQPNLLTSASVWPH